MPWPQPPPVIVNVAAEASDGTDQCDEKGARRDEGGANERPAGGC